MNLNPPLAETTKLYTPLCATVKAPCHETMKLKPRESLEQKDKKTKRQKKSYLVKERPGRATELKEIKLMIPELLKAASLVGIVEGTDWVAPRLK